MKLPGQILGLLLFVPTLVSAQFYELSAPLNERTPSMETNIQWTEDADARTTHSSTSYSNDGQIKIRNSARPINYEISPGVLIPIDPLLKKQKEGGWAALQQPYPTYLEKNGSFRISCGNGKSIGFGNNIRVQNLEYHPDFSVENNQVHFEAINGISRHLIFRENGVKYAYEVNQIPQGNQNLVFTETVALPSGFTVEFEAETGKMESYGWTGNIQIKNEKGEIVCTLLAPVCYDQNNAVKLAGYSIEKNMRSCTLSLTLPTEWLNAANRAFPIVIDPLVVGPLASWAGGSMPSCLTPSYNVDSILVTIPGGISVTQLNVTASFYADPFTPAIMSDGRMFFSTSCDNTQIFSISGPNGALPGTAYLDSFDLHNPITCCYAESCSDQTFYLRYHLQRIVLGAGCNTTYIRYDPVTTSWPFEAVVVGRTPESFSAQWNVPSVPICSNNCSLNGTAYVYYGVPPYTMIHPWSADTIVVGTNVGCSSGATTYNMQLDIPNCPSYCDENFTTLDVPPPTITDACGSIVSGLPTRVVPIKTAPQVSAAYTKELCSGEVFEATITPCVNGATVQWTGNNQTGTSQIYDTLYTATPGQDNLVQYQASAQSNGCYSDTITFTTIVHPLPDASFTWTPEIIVSSVEAQFFDATNFNNSQGAGWFWNMGDGTLYSDPDHAHTYTAPGQYEVCLAISDLEGCTDSTCQLVSVIPAEVERPNVITANNDGVNDYLAFRYLEFYPDNELYVYNRWGNEVFHTTNYKNDWNGGSVTEGTYFFRLIIQDTGDDFQGYFQIIH